jgi:hypothetical protein
VIREEHERPLAEAEGSYVGTHALKIANEGSPEDITAVAEIPLEVCVSFVQIPRGIEGSRHRSS